MSGQGSPQGTTPEPSGSGHAPPNITGRSGTGGSAGSPAAGGGRATRDGQVNNSPKYAALRVGWMMAEARGNLLRLGERPDDELEGFPSLPLDAADERTKSEHTIEVVKVLATLAGGSGLDLAASTLTIPTKLPATSETKASGLLRLLAWRHLRALGWKRLGPTLGLSEGEADDSLRLSAEKTKKQLAGFLWAWDEAIQDTLAAEEFGTSSSYQLGRGLAETYWALDPDARSGPESWEKLLCNGRATALGLLLDRLSLTVLPPVSAAAIKFALEKWEGFAKDLSRLGWAAGDEVGRAFRSKAREDLGLQVKKWKDLLLMAADSTDFADPGNIAKASRSSRHIFAFYLPEIVSGAVASGALGVCLYYLVSSGTSYQAPLSALSGLGLTGTVGVGIIKSFSQGVTNRVHAATDLDAVKDAFTWPPPPIPKR